MGMHDPRCIESRIPPLGGGTFVKRGYVPQYSIDLISRWSFIGSPIDRQGWNRQCPVIRRLDTAAP